MSFLKIKNLSQTLGKKQILKKVSFDLKKGELVAFLGPNGAGKTTLLKTIIGLLPIQSSDVKTDLILLENRNINNWPVNKRVDAGLLYLPQQSSLFQQMSVIDNLKLVFQYYTYWTKNKNNKEKQFKVFNDEMKHWLKKTNLENHINQNAETLSGGQKRKLEVVRTLLMHPKAIMFDEPFAGVDPKSIYELKKIFIDMSQNNIAVLISDHNVDQLLSIATKIYVVIDGEIVTSGGIKDIINCKNTKEVYFGNQFYTEIANRFL